MNKYIQIEQNLHTKTEVIQIRINVLPCATGEVDGADGGGEVDGGEVDEVDDGPREGDGGEGEGDGADGGGEVDGGEVDEVDV